jgi:hypothetical protein
MSSVPMSISSSSLNSTHFLIFTLLLWPLPHHPEMPASLR